ncbi:MAG: hypothetical protein ABJZ55_20535 [Fuerstiella sp.]
MSNQSKRKPTPELELSEEAVLLLDACKAVARALQHEAEENGTVIWMVPPDQLPAVHESAGERLISTIAKVQNVSFCEAVELVYAEA